MRRLSTIQILTAAALVAGVFATNNTVAAASPADYRRGMIELAPVVRDWAEDVQLTADAALTKPELACSAHMAELANRGFGITDDLIGTGLNAPRGLMASHAALQNAVARMADAAAGACYNPAGSAVIINGETTDLNRALIRVRNFAEGAFGGGR